MKRVLTLITLSAMLLLAGSAFAAPTVMGFSGPATSTGGSTSAVYGPNTGSTTSTPGFGQMGASGVMSGFGQAGSTAVSYTHLTLPTKRIV